MNPLPPPGFSPGSEECFWGSGGLELRAGWRVGGGHDLHVLGEDGLERLVSVHHGTKHQWLDQTQTLGRYLQSDVLIELANFTKYSNNLTKSQFSFASANTPDFNLK